MKGHLGQADLTQLLYLCLCETVVAFLSLVDTCERSFFEEQRESYQLCLVLLFLMVSYDRHHVST